MVEVAFLLKEQGPDLRYLNSVTCPSNVSQKFDPSGTAKADCSFMKIWFALSLIFCASDSSCSPSFSSSTDCGPTYFLSLRMVVTMVGCFLSISGVTGRVCRLLRCSRHLDISGRWKCRLCLIRRSRSASFCSVFRARTFSCLLAICFPLLIMSSSSLVLSVFCSSFFLLLGPL